MTIRDSSASRGRRCLVTGGAGFIGSHLVDALLADGHHVTAVDNLSTGRARNLEHLGGHPRFRFVGADAADRAALAPVVAEADEVYHLASYVGVKLASMTSSQTILNNLRAIDTILDLVTQHRPRFLLTSTSEVYGKALDAAPPGATLHEHADRVYGSTEVHRWSYAGIKAVEEFLTLAKHHEEGLHAVIVRLFNVIGPRQVGRHGPVVPRFIDQALAGEPITIYGAGTQQRCFTYIDDAIDAIRRLMALPEAAGEAYNVGGCAPVAVAALAERVRVLAGSTAAPVHVPYEAAYGEHFEDVNVRIPDTAKLEQATGFTITRSLDDALRRTIDAHPLARVKRRKEVGE